MNNRNKGFTMVEVLGVLVIIGILSLLVVPRIIEYMQGGKDDYNQKLASQLKLAGKAYFADNKEALPTEKTSKKYGYVTWDELDSEKYITKDLVDSEGNSCSSSYVHVRQNTFKSGVYDYTPCLICEDQNGNIINHTDNNTYCTVSNWSDDSAPTCDDQDINYTLDDTITIHNPDDKISKVSSTPGTIRAIILETDQDTIIENESAGIKVGETVTIDGTKVNIVNDNQLQIFAEDMTKEDIEKIDFKKIFEQIFNPTKREGRTNQSAYTVYLTDGINDSDSCATFYMGGKKTVLRNQDSDICDLTIKGTALTVNHLVMKNGINDVYYIGQGGNHVSIMSSLPAQKTETRTKDTYYQVGYKYIEPGTQIAVPEGIDTFYVRDGKNAAEYGPTECNVTIEKEGIVDDTPDCEGEQKGTNLVLTATDNSQITDIYYINNTGEKISIMPNEEMNKAEFKGLKVSNVPVESSIKVKDNQGQVSTCDVVHDPENTASSVACTINKKDDKDYLTKTDRENTYIATCKDSTGSNIELANNWQSLITTINAKGIIKNATQTGNGRKKITITITYQSYDMVAGLDAIKLKQGMVRSTDKIKNLPETTSNNFKVDTTAPSIIYKPTGQTGSFYSQSGVYIIPFNLQLLCYDTGSGVKQMKETNSSGKKISNPKQYTVKSASTTKVDNKVYPTYCVDAAGNSSTRSETYKVINAPLPKCKVTIPTGWVKKDDTKTIVTTCAMPTNSGGTLTVIDNSKQASYDRKGVVAVTSTTGNGTGITRTTSTYKVNDGKTGTDRIIVGQGFARSNSNQLNAQEISAKINIDAAPPSLKFNYKSNDKDSPKHAPFIFKVSCSDVGSGVKSITMNGKTYNTTSKEVTIKTAQQGITYTAYCTDKAGNKSSTVTAKYYVQIKSANSKCGVLHYKSCKDDSCPCTQWKRSCSRCSGCDKYVYQTRYKCSWANGGTKYTTRGSVPGCRNKGCSSGTTTNYSGSCKVNYMYQALLSKCGVSSGRCYGYDLRKCKCSSYSYKTSKCVKGYCKRCKGKNPRDCEKGKHKKCEAKDCGVKSYKTCWHY